MNDYSILEQTAGKYGAVVLKNEPMKNHTSFRIGGPCDVMIKINCEALLCELIKQCRENDIKYYVVGRGSNILVCDEGLQGVVLLIGSDFGSVRVNGEYIECNAGASLAAVCAVALENELTGLEFAYGIPGSVGGAIFMNAGAYVTGAQLKKLGEYYAKAIHEHYGDDFDVLFGPAYKGIPLRVATTIAFSELYGKEIRYCSNRKEVKDHGDTGILLGSKIKDGDKVVIIEDVTTSGKSIEETFPIIKAQGDVEIIGLMVSLNRMERGLTSNASALDEIQQKYGFGANAIVTMEDVVECLYNKECQGRVLIDDNLKAAIDAYYAEYGVH